MSKSLSALFQARFRALVREWNAEMDAQGYAEGPRYDLDETDVQMTVRLRQDPVPKSSKKKGKTDDVVDMITIDLDDEDAPDIG